MTYPENPGELPVLKLCNKFKPNCPKTEVTPMGPLGVKHNKDAELVKHLQSMLRILGYDLGTTGENEDGVDGDFGEKTRAAVVDFQENHTDWKGKKLDPDGKVGPKTADALNRTMVGRWYDHYQTPRELVEGKPYHTIVSDFLTRESILIDPGKAKEGKVFLVGSIPAPIEFMILYPALGLPAIMADNTINVILLFKKNSKELRDVSPENDDYWQKIKEAIANKLRYMEWEKRDSDSDQRTINPSQLIDLSFIEVVYKKNDGKINYKEGDTEINLVAAKSVLDYLAENAQFDITRVLRLHIKFDGLEEKLYDLVNKGNRDSEYVTKVLNAIRVPGDTPKMKNELTTLRKNNQVKRYHPFYVSNKEDLSIGHITDVHVSTRWYLYERILKNVHGSKFDSLQFNNYNETFTKLLQDINQKADIILLTGDLIDYNRGHLIDISKDDNNVYNNERSFENHYLFNRNWVLFYELLMDNYKKPVFTVLGNHEYLLNPYNTNAKIRVTLTGHSIPIIDIPIMTEYNSFSGDMNLKESESQFEPPLGTNLDIFEALKLKGYREAHDEDGLTPMMKKSARELIENRRSGCWYSDKESATWYFLIINPFKDYCFTYQKTSFLMLDWNVKQLEGSLILLPRPTDCISTEQFELIDSWVKHDVKTRILCSHAPVYDPWEDLGNFYLEKGIIKIDHDSTEDYVENMTDRFSSKLNLGTIEKTSRSKLLQDYIFNPQSPIHIVLSGHSHTNRIFQLIKDETGKEHAVLRGENSLKEWNTDSPFIIITNSGGPMGRTNYVAEWMDMLLPGYRILNFDDIGKMKAENQCFFLKNLSIRNEVIEDAVKNDPSFILPTGVLNIIEKQTIKRFSTFDGTKNVDPDLSAIIDDVSGNAKIEDLNDGRAIVVKQINQGAKLSIENNDGTIVIENNCGELVVNDNDDFINIDYNYGIITIKQNDDTIFIRDNRNKIEVYSNGTSSPGTDIIKVFENNSIVNIQKPHGNEDTIVIKRNQKDGILNINYNNDEINIAHNRGLLNINSNEGGALEVDSVINIFDNSEGTINIKNNDGEVNINESKKGKVNKLEKSGEIYYKPENWLKEKYNFD